LASAGGPGAYCAWRSGAAQALQDLGEHEEAVTLAEDELAHARGLGSGRMLGAALRTRARLAPDAAAIALLHEAVGALQGTEAVLERAGVDVDLGAALRRSGRRRDSRVPLRRGLDVARRCGARLMAERAAVELEASGARRPDLPVTGAEALTPSERRVARLATEGRSNREIAASLFVTRKTVEAHLSSTYRKLAISSREELPSALA
jgi:DNA-binding CsgD family transcriptional regulator